MKAITHDAFSLGVGLYLAYRVEQPPTLTFLLLVVWLAFATNEVIDILGHMTRGGRSVRSFWTHSVFTAPVWGIAVALASAYLLGAVVGQAMSISQGLFAGVIGVVFAFSHLLLDSLTEGGIYLGERRLALAHLRYDNYVLNGVFTALGVLLVFAALA